MPRSKALALLLSLATLSASAVAQYGQNASPAGPGTVNYVEGQAMLAGHPLNQRSNAAIQPGQVLTTGNGKAEILLTPASSCASARTPPSRWSRPT